MSLKTVNNITDIPKGKASRSMCVKPFFIKFNMKLFSYILNNALYFAKEFIILKLLVSKAVYVYLAELLLRSIVIFDYFNVLILFLN